MDTDRKTILLVEDNLYFQKQIPRFIYSCGLNVCIKTVENGERAQDYLTGQPPYNREKPPLPVLIVTDVNMPRMTGLTLLKWVKQQPYLKNIPVILMNTSTSKNLVSQAINLGAHSYLLKLTHPKNLVDMIKTIITKQTLS